jgi:hypothetical protein
MNESTKIAELLEQRQARRLRLAKLSFEEKIEIIERLRELQFNRDLMKNKDEAGRMRDELRDEGGGLKDE